MRFPLALSWQTQRLQEKPVEPLTGVIAILATPFTEGGDVDWEGFLNLVEAAMGDGVHGLAMFGLASEYYKLTEAERTKLTEWMIQQVNGRVPVIISITDHAREVAVQHGREAVALGADTLMVMPPFFLSPSADAFRRHVEAIASPVAVPIILQYAPLQAGRTVEAEVFAGLHRSHPNVTHIKVDLVPSGSVVTA